MSKEDVGSNLDTETLRFLALKSEYVINAQLESQRAKESNSSIIIGVISLFIPFFLNGIAKSHTYLQWASVVPFLGFLCALALFLKILSGTPVMRSIRPEKFNALASQKINEVLKTEIGSNYTAYEENMKVYNQMTRVYSRAVMCTICSVIISAILLAIDKFV